uniref:Uncharacterized protein n=1 Tax=Strigamia maritima TaxID=126957 RepID=T1JDC2_STRMM
MVMQTYRIKYLRCLRVSIYTWMCTGNTICDLSSLEFNRCSTDVSSNQTSKNWCRNGYDKLIGT